MIEVYTHDYDGYRTVFASGTWRIGLIGRSARFASLSEMERHLETDEVFVLLEGGATLYTETERLAMETGKVYNIPRGVWHHVVISPDGKVLVAENSDTSAANTEKKTLKGGETPC